MAQETAVRRFDVSKQRDADDWLNLTFLAEPPRSIVPILSPAA
ncbi:hypothetical protein EV663_11755 [Rhodovulum bhavnagarense]|uniref:Uncharacterized protein n=1 Tax=Rhodovulum bhavnagarense TaxID=992286 RepID=A0A4R2R9Y0_9RHOB|nr:hypothetical protein [Rhodovulum bhavnagarense]TCP58789.1 hypothetical protein EV663_11755 [Rhodovulum bhavnagarense]